MSKLLFKIMANSYYRHQEQNILMQDCLSAINHQINSMQMRIKTETQEIQEILSQASQHEPQMSIIMQQETQRSVTDNLSFSQWINQVKDNFDIQINKLNKVDRNVDKLINIYKNQLLEMSKQITKFQKQQQDLKSEVKKVKQQKKQLQTEIAELKDQITSQTAYIIQNEESIFEAPQNQNQPQNYESKPNNYTEPLKSKTLQRQQNKVKINQKKATNQKCGNNKIDENANIVQIRVHSQKQMDQDLQKWKKLSKKIQDLKVKLVIYEDEIYEKDQKIQKLTKIIKEHENGINNESRKLKAANTTLRGEKTVLINQLNSLKKDIALKLQLCNAKDIEIQQLRLKAQNNEATIKWQNTTINELRSTTGKAQNRLNNETKEKISKLMNSNQQLLLFIAKQQNQFDQMDSKTKQIQEMLCKKLQQFQNRIQQLELILDEKNEFIVKMKAKVAGIENTNYSNNSNSNAYLNELVKVLTKKVADRDQTIRKLQMCK